MRLLYERVHQSLVCFNALVQMRAVFISIFSCVHFFRLIIGCVVLLFCFFLQEGTPWSAISKTFPDTADGSYVVEDHVCCEVFSLITNDELSMDQKWKQRTNLLLHLNNNWDKG